MLLAGDDSATSKQGLVKLLAPPQGAEVGDRYPETLFCSELSPSGKTGKRLTSPWVRVYLEGQQPSSDPAACLNHKQWGKVVPEFAVVGTVALGVAVTAATLPLT